MKHMKPIAYLSIAAGSLIYAVPQLEMGQGWTMPTIFGAVWLALVLLVIAAQLHEVLGVDEKIRREREKLRRFRLYTLEQKLLRPGRAARRREEG